MFDFNRTLQLIKGAIFDADATWRSYLPEAGNWLKTACLLTGPLIVLSAVLGYLIGFLGSDTSLFGFRPTLVSTLIGMVTGAIAIGVFSLILGILSGLFGGRNSFALALAASSLAFVPGYLGQALNWLPWIGTLVMLGLMIYGLVLLWRIIPMYLDVPDNKRAGHFILSLVAAIVVMFILSMLLRPVLAPAMPGLGDLRGGSGSAAGASGMFGGAIRQAELLAEVEDHRYDPPADGELDDDQVAEYARVMSRVREMLEDKAERTRELAERAERDEQLSLGEMSEMMSGATQVMGMNLAEMEVVVSGNGNWAEHQWVRESLRRAYVQKDANAAIAHNYDLYLEYEDELKPFVAR